MMKTLIKKLIPQHFWVEFKAILNLAWPIILMNLFRFINPTVSVIMCGHLSKTEFDAASLANSIINVFGVSIDLGFSTACDTLFAQIYGGKNKRKLGLMLQRAMLVMTVIYVLLCCVHLNVEPILIFLQQDVEISRLTARYVALYLPGLFFDFHFLTISRYLQNQNIVYPMMVSAFFGAVFNGVSQYIALYVLGYRIDASAILQAIGCLVMFTIQLSYVLITKVYKETWQGIEFRNSLEAWGIFFKLGIPGIVMIGVEEWSFEIGNFLAGSLSATQLGAQSVAFNTEFFCYNVHVGLAIAAAIRCGQFLGSNKPNEAAACAKVVIVTDFFISLVTMVLLLALRSYIPLLFTDDKDIQVLSQKIFIILAIIQLFDAGCSSTAGIFRACGRQLNGAVVMCACYYILGIPLGLILIFVVKMDITGFWIGLVCGLMTEVVIYLIMLYRINWEQEAAKAKRNEQMSKLSTTEKDEFDETKKLLDPEENVSKENDYGVRQKQHHKKGNLSISHNQAQFDLSHRRGISGTTDILKSWVVASNTDPLDSDPVISSNKPHLTSSLSYKADRLIIKRLILVFFVLLLFIFALMLNIYLPRGSYIPCITLTPNGTISATLPLDKHYPYCNDTIYH